MIRRICCGLLPAARVGETGVLGQGCVAAWKQHECAYVWCGGTWGGAVSVVCEWGMYVSVHLQAQNGFDKTTKEPNLN